MNKKAFKGILGILVAGIVSGGAAQAQAEVQTNALPMMDVSIDTGKNHVVYVDADKNLWTWGTNKYGEVGHHLYNKPSQLTFSDGTLVDNVQEAIAGQNITVFLRNGQVYTLGANFDLQLGIGKPKYDANTGYFTIRKSPEKVEGLENIIDIAHNNGRTYAVSSTGEVFAFGKNQDNFLGVGEKGDVTTPTKINGLENIVEVEAGDNHALARTATGEVYAWGMNNNNSLATGTTGIIPAKVIGIDQATDIEAGNGFSMAILEDSSLFGWGENYAHQLGYDSNNVCKSKYDKGSVESSPVRINKSEGEPFSNVSGVTIINDVAYVQTSDIETWAWDCSSPKVINDLPMVKDFAINEEGTMMLMIRHDNEVWGKGSTTEGFYGNGISDYASKDPRSVPLFITGEAKSLLGTAQWYKNQGSEYNALYFGSQAFLKEPLNQKVKDFMKDVAKTASSKAYNAFHAHDDITSEKYYQMVYSFDGIPEIMRRDAKINLAYVYYGRGNWYFANSRPYNALYFASKSIEYGNTNASAKNLITDSSNNLYDLAKRYEGEGRIAEAKEIYRLLNDTNGVPGNLKGN